MNVIGHIFDGGSGFPLSDPAVALARFMMDYPNQIHTRAALAGAGGFDANGRSCDTYVAQIRKALGTLDRIVATQRIGYGWVGEDVAIVPCVKPCSHPTDPMIKFTVMPQSAVARKLGISVAEVKRIEKSAISKIKKTPDLIEVWHQAQKEIDRCSYDPFHEVWLFSVGVKKHETT